MMTGRDSSVWEDLVVAILSVNRYSLERTYSKVDRIRREGLFEPANLFRWAPTEIALRLRTAGYDRGQFMTALFAERLASLGKHLQCSGVENCREILLTGDADSVKKLLLPAKGIGPIVLANFLLLRGH
jgi:hypothetical protein